MKLAIVAWHKLSFRTSLLTNILPNANLWFFEKSPFYINAILGMFIKFLKQKPNTVIVQLPQGILLFQAVLLKKILGLNLVADVHTGFVINSGLKGYILNKLFIQFLCSTDLVIVHNDQLKILLSSLVGNKIIVVYDPWISMSKSNIESIKFDYEYYVFPASFASDGRTIQ